MNSSADGWVTIAVLGKTRGNRGEVTAFPLSSKLERFENLNEVYLFGAGERREVESTWFHNGTLIFKFQGVDSISEAETLRGADVLIPREERVQLEPGEFFHSDLVGCEVRDRVSDRLIGMITGWEEFGGPALLEVDNGRMLIPFVKAICTEILPDARVVRVDLPEGLETLNQ